MFDVAQVPNFAVSDAPASLSLSLSARGQANAPQPRRPPAEASSLGSNPPSAVTRCSPPTHMAQRGLEYMKILQNALNNKPQRSHQVEHMSSVCVGRSGPSPALRPSPDWPAFSSHSSTCNSDVRHDSLCQTVPSLGILKKKERAASAASRDMHKSPCSQVQPARGTYLALMGLRCLAKMPITLSNTCKVAAERALHFAGCSGCCRSQNWHRLRLEMDNARFSGELRGWKPLERATQTPASLGGRMRRCIIWVMVSST